MGRWLHRIVLAAALLTALDANVGSLHAQGLTGQVTGTVTVENVGAGLVRERLPGRTVLSSSRTSWPERSIFP